MWSSVRVPLLFMGALLSLQFGCKARSKDTKLPIFNALVREYETVFVADAALLSGSGVFSTLPRNSLGKLQAPFAYLMEVVSGNDHLQRHLLGSAEVVAVGAKNFRPPAALGAVLSDLCYVLTLSRGFSGDIRRYGIGSQVATVNGWPVWSWTVRTGEPTSEITFFIAQPVPTLILIANDLKSLRSTAEHILSARPEGDALRALSDAREILSSPIFGYRRYRHDATGLSKQASGAMEVSLAAEALVLLANLRSHLISIRYLSASASDRTVEKLSGAGRLPKFIQTKPTMWQTAVPLLGSEQIQEQLFTAISLFGFGVYL